MLKFSRGGTATTVNVRTKKPEDTDGSETVIQSPTNFARARAIAELQLRFASQTKGTRENEKDVAAVRSTAKNVTGNVTSGSDQYLTTSAAHLCSTVVHTCSHSSPVVSSRIVAKTTVPVPPQMMPPPPPPPPPPPFPCSLPQSPVTVAGGRTDHFYVPMKETLRSPVNLSPVPTVVSCKVNKAAEPEPAYDVPRPRPVRLGSFGRSRCCGDNDAQKQQVTTEEDVSCSEATARISSPHSLTPGHPLTLPVPPSTSGFIRNTCQRSSVRISKSTCAEGVGGSEYRSSPRPASSEVATHNILNVPRAEDSYSREWNHPHDVEMKIRRRRIENEYVFAATTTPVEYANVVKPGRSDRPNGGDPLYKRSAAVPISTGTDAQGRHNADGMSWSPKERMLPPPPPTPPSTPSYTRDVGDTDYAGSRLDNLDRRMDGLVRQLEMQTLALTAMSRVCSLESFGHHSSEDDTFSGHRTPPADARPGDNLHQPGRFVRGGSLKRTMYTAGSNRDSLLIGGQQASAAVPPQHQNDCRRRYRFHDYENIYESDGFEVVERDLEDYDRRREDCDSVYMLASPNSSRKPKKSRTHDENGGTGVPADSTYMPADAFFKKNTASYKVANPKSQSWTRPRGLLSCIKIKK